MLLLLSALPIASVLVLMAGLRWGTHKAGAVGLIVTVTIGAAFFGLTPEVFGVSQAKGLLLSAYVLAVMWPALFLFHLLNCTGGIDATAQALKRFFPDRGLCALAMAWCLTGVFEGIAGFGLPVAIVSPMLIAIGIKPVRAVAAVAIGHSWAVTFGSMGVIFETLVAITQITPRDLAPWAALFLGAGCIACGFGAAAVLGQCRQWRIVLSVGSIMALAQYALAIAGLSGLGSLGAAATGLIIWGSLIRFRNIGAQTAKPSLPAGLRPTLVCYGGLAALMAVLALAPGVRNCAGHLAWKASFQEVTTNSGFVTAAGYGPLFRPLTHPGALILIAAAAAAVYLSKKNPSGTLVQKAAAATVASGGLATVGILCMVGISTLMDHCGMTLTLARAASRATGAAFPLVSPLIGVLGAFATGSNNNSNIMFATLQKSAASMLAIAPTLVLGTQTAGGSLGSMIAPAKLVIGCSTAGLTGSEGMVLRKTIPVLLAIALGIGVVALALASAS